MHTPRTVFFLLAVLLSASCWAQSTLNVNIKNVRSGKGVCCVVLFSNPKAFPAVYKQAVESKTIKAEKGITTVQFSKVPAGTYAIAVIHDENNDGKLNTNIIGIPKEGYGASNNRLPLMSAPDFKTSSFTVLGKDESLEIDLKYF